MKNSEIGSGKIDLYKLLPQETRVVIERNFAIKIKKKLKNNFESLKKYCEKKNVNFAAFQGWFTKLNRGPKLNNLINIAKDGGIGKEIVFDKVRMFYTGHKGNAINFPRKIAMNKKLIKGLGLYVGEGQRKSNKVALSNTEPRILNFFIKWLNGIFDVDMSNIRGYLYIPKEDVDKEKVKKKWNKKIKLRKNQLKSIYYYENSKKECCLLVYGNKIIHDIINSLIPIIKKVVKEKKKFIIPYLQGLFAAEGDVRIKGENIHHIELGMKNREEITFISDLLKRLNIDASIKNNKGCFTLTVNRKVNIKKLVNVNIFELHPERKRLLEKALDNFVQSQVGRNKVLEHYATYFKKNKILTVKKLMKLTGKSESQCRRILKRFFEENIIERSKKGNTYSYYPNNKKIIEEVIK